MTRALYAFPESGMPRNALDAELDSLRQSMTPEHAGKFASTAFWGIDSARDVVRDAHSKFFDWNALFSFQEPAAAKFENEVLDICTGLAGGAADSAGNLTSGGTESNFSGLYAMRGWAREHKPGIRQPEVLAPWSVHSTVHKMAAVLDLKVVTVPQNEDLSADVEGIAAAITPNTIGIVGSAPSWPYGRVDPIESLGKLAIEHELWLHVDACVGGFLLPFFRELGEDIPAFDLSVPGVRSMTMDLHKYAFAPKPCSVAL